jgi:hypothetical protein
MRKAILAVLAASALAALGTAPAEAVGTRYPFCLQGDEYPGLSYCTFTSYEQCQATRRPPRIARFPAARCRPPPATAGTDPSAEGRWRAMHAHR